MSVSIEVDGKPVAAKQGKGVHVQAHVDYQNAEEPILVKVGISAVSVEAARKNLAAEIPAWDFAGTVAAATASWSDRAGPHRHRGHRPGHPRGLLHGASITPASPPRSTTTPTAAIAGWTTRCTARKASRTTARSRCGTPSGRSIRCLTIVQPQRVDDFVATMLAHYRQFGHHTLPIWSLAGNETWCMIGNHAIPVIAEAYAKGFRRYDVEAVYQAMRDASMQDRDHLGEYRAKGYVPSSTDLTTPRGEQNQSVSRTLEYAYDDWCVGRMAATAGKDGRRQALLRPLQELPQRVRPGRGIHARQVGRRQVARAVQRLSTFLGRLHRGHGLAVHLLRAPERAGA